MGDRGSTGQGRAPAVHVVTLEGESAPHVELLVEWLSSTHAIERHRVSLTTTAAALQGEARRTFDLFDHTPQPLIDAWLFARAIAATVPDGGVVLVSDAHGIGGMVALEESQRAFDARRRVWSVAGAGRFLSETVTYGTTGHLQLPEASDIDWELTQYRHADEVLATSRLAADLLAGIGISARVPDEGEAAARPRRERARRVFAPGPVARRNRTGDILRAVSGLDGVHLVVSDRDTTDAVWNGTTWDTLSDTADRLGSRVERAAEPPRDVDLVVIGDALAVPSRSTRDLHRRGVAVAAPVGSVAATMWGDVIEWSTSDELAAVIHGADRPVEGSSQPAPPVTASSGRRHDPRRARRVSVGIPAHGAPRYLDACIDSVRAQTEPVGEILITDDGSQSPELDGALERWAATDDRIRVLRQPHRGVCVARNHMLDAMTGDAFVLVDQDDILAPEFIAAAATALRSDGSIDAVAVWTEFFGEYAAIEAKPPFDRRVAQRENPIVSTAALIDMAVRDRGIRFEPDLAFLFCEDWNFWSQIVAAGGRMGLVPAPLIRHRVHRSSGGFRRTDLALHIGRARALAPFDGSRS